jgi:hypothetical protein
MIRLTKHAAEAVEKRNLDTDWIERAITMPDFTAVDPHDVTLTRSFKVIEQVGGRVLRVVHRPEQNDILVVTAHFDRNAKP